MAKKPTGKKLGRLPDEIRPLPPEIMPEIAEMYLEGYEETQIAARFNVARNAIHHHIRNTIKPIWKEQLRVIASEELARVNHLETVAWRMFRKSQEPMKAKEMREVLDKDNVPVRLIKKSVRGVTAEVHWMQVIQWCIDYRTKIAGLYPSQRVQVDAEVRVAGQTPEQFTTETIDTILSKVAEKRKAQRTNLN